MLSDDSGSSSSVTTVNFTVESVRRRAEEGDAAAQCNYGFLLCTGNGIAMDKSLAAHYFKLSADQGDASAQFNYAVLLQMGDGIAMDKSLAAHYYKLSADQRHADAQCNY
jgi:TPR repeat protein